MKLLILGGTVFLGRHCTQAALDDGHEVTLFTRGQHNPDLFPEAEHLRGDRTTDLSALAGRTWDAAIDTSGYLPRVVAASADRLADAVGRYLFVSTVSVYRDFRQPGTTEDAPVGTLAEPDGDEVTGESYGPLKALCEQAVQRRLQERALIVRPGLIVGPYDPTDRFTYWPVRCAVEDDEPILAPGPPERPAQWIDARDLAAWLLRLLTNDRTGVFNAVGPATPATMGDLVRGCQAAAGTAQPIEWLDEQVLLDAGIEPWMGLPLWIPASDADSRCMQQVSNARALAAGLTTRPLEDTARDTLAWYRQRPAAEPRAGISRERERAVLATWRQRLPAVRP